ncbi:MAG: hypothetical protein HY810_03290 [Candidatus Omnitrophica bacterium]|nr:hypothetical protein [Candidatus Omnitrophota bacterium]
MRYFNRVIMIFCAIVILAFAGIILIDRAYLASYKLYMDRTLVANVECKINQQTKQKLLKVNFNLQSAISAEALYSFDADEWVIEGRFIKWKPFLGLFGIKRYYRVERLSGRYFDAEKEKNSPRVVYALADTPDRFWFLLYRLQRFCPFIDAMYGNSAFIPFEDGKLFNIYVTGSGFMIKDMSVPKKRSWLQVG